MSRVDSHCFNEYGRKYSDMLKDGIKSLKVDSVIEACGKLIGHGSYDYDIREALPLAQEIGNAEMIAAAKEHCGYDRENGETCSTQEYSVSYSGDYTIASCDEFQG